MQNINLISRVIPKLQTFEFSEVLAYIHTYVYVYIHIFVESHFLDVSHYFDIKMSKLIFFNDVSCRRKQNRWFINNKENSTFVTVLQLPNFHRSNRKNLKTKTQSKKNCSKQSMEAYICGEPRVPISLACSQ